MSFWPNIFIPSQFKTVWLRNGCESYPHY